MGFIKKNSYEIVRLMLNQFALSVFGIVLITAARQRIKSGFDWLSLVVSIFSTLFYLYILYATLLEIGGKHKVKVEAGSMVCDRRFGLKLMLLAQIPNFVILLFMFLGWLFGHAVTHASFFAGMYGVAQIIVYFMQSMYDGIIGVIIPAVDSVALSDVEMIRISFFVWLAYLLSVIPAILVSWGSYILGLEDKKLFFKRPPTSGR